MSDAIRKLIAETNDLPKAELPGMWSWMVNHPGAVAYKTKSPERFDADARRAYFLEKAQEADPEFFRSQPDLLKASQSENMAALRSAYEPYRKPGQLLGEESPVWNLGVSMASLPSAIYATGQMVANKAEDAMDSPTVTYPDAPDLYAESIKNIGAIGGSRRELQEMRRRQDELPWTIVNPGPMEAAIQSQYKPNLMDGETYLTQAGVNPTASKWVGAGMDVVLEPVSGVGGAVKAARAGKQLSAMKSLGSDAAIGTAPVWLPTAIDGGVRVRELLKGP